MTSLSMMTFTTSNTSPLRLSSPAFSSANSAMVGGGSRRSRSYDHSSSPNVKIATSPRRCAIEMEMQELEAEASHKECVMLQRILQHRLSQTSASGCDGDDEDSSSSSLNAFVRSPSQLALVLKSADLSESHHKNLHQVLLGNLSQRQAQHVMEQPHAYHDHDVHDDDQAEEDDGVFDLDM